MLRQIVWDYDLLLSKLEKTRKDSIAVEIINQALREENTNLRHQLTNLERNLKEEQIKHSVTAKTFTAYRRAS